MYAFLSYQTEHKVAAGKVKAVLAELDISSFLAHEDIDVSDEWRLRILEEIAKADVFIPILSRSFYQSCWCVQESGIAAFRNTMVIIPLSIDGTVPQGFLAHIQSTRIDPEYLAKEELFPGLAKRDVSFVIDNIIKMIGASQRFRGAEANFQLILPYLSKATDDQVLRLLQRSADNGQVWHAALCALEYLPPLVASHGHLLDPERRKVLTDTCVEYARRREAV